MNESKMRKINPLSGRNDLFITVPLSLIFLLITIYGSGVVKIIFLVLSLILFIFISGILYGRLSKPWRRLHFPIMHKYSYFAGYQIGLIEHYNGNDVRHFDVSVSLEHLLQYLYPDLNTSKIKEMIEQAENKLLNFSDREDIKNYLITNKRTIDKNKLDDLLTRTHEEMVITSNYNAYLVRYVIADIIEREYSEEEKMKYIHSMFTGDAF